MDVHRPDLSVLPLDGGRLNRLLVCPPRRTRRPPLHLLVHIFRRSVLIYLIGFALVLIPDFNWATVRIPGVLARIAVCYLIAGTIFLFTGIRGRVAAAVACLSAYWILMMYVPVPGIGAGHWEKGANFANWVDGIVFGSHNWSHSKTWDPEGLISTLPSIVTALLGTFAGTWLRSDHSREEKTVGLFLAGNLGIFAGLVLATWMPINKSLWTDSFCLFMAGMASVIFASCYWLIDVKGYKRVAPPFQVFGMNPIAAYVLSAVLARLLSRIHVNGRQSLHNWIFQTLYAPIAAPDMASLLFASTEVLVILSIAWMLHRKQWYLRL